MTTRPATKPVLRPSLMQWGHRALRLWWRLRRPTTYGVKALLIHPEDPGKCLAVRHSYVDQDRWGLPGGGYNPKRETAAQAAVREVAEELALTIQQPPTVLRTLTTELEGKLDNLTIVAATPAAAGFRLNAELIEARWVAVDLSDLPAGAPVSRWLKLARSAVIGEEGAADGHREDRDDQDQRRRDQDSEQAGHGSERQPGGNR
ncbi:NUDIX domain-containing protein [Kribbella sp. NPDC051620]|uniref:NUDIX domain-containing protein n=1 Tax=Kribbella sp. NPDC051620 TaxID=3364120 RepID=UPI0037A7E791